MGIFSPEKPEKLEQNIADNQKRYERAKAAGDKSGALHYKQNVITLKAKLKESKAYWKKRGK